MTGRPEPSEAAPYYSTYINQVEGSDPLGVIETQLDHALILFEGITEEKSLHKYAPDKWSIREVLNHVNDTERLFAFRALWFARGFTDPLPSYDQNAAVLGAEADRIDWHVLIEEFRRVRLATVSLLRTLPPEAWLRGGIASGRFFTVRALAFIIPGHVTHHLEILRTRYS